MIQPSVWIEIFLCAAVRLKIKISFQCNQQNTLKVLVTIKNSAGSLFSNTSSFLTIRFSNKKFERNFIWFSNKENVVTRSTERKKRNIRDRNVFFFFFDTKLTLYIRYKDHSLDEIQTFRVSCTARLLISLIYMSFFLSLIWFSRARNVYTYDLLITVRKMTES